jgi:hypothetical protein
MLKAFSCFAICNARSPEKKAGKKNAIFTNQVMLLNWIWFICEEAVLIQKKLLRIIYPFCLSSKYTLHHKIPRIVPPLS